LERRKGKRARVSERLKKIRRHQEVDSTTNKGENFKRKFWGADNSGGGIRSEDCGNNAGKWKTTKKKKKQDVGEDRTSETSEIGRRDPEACRTGFTTSVQGPKDSREVSSQKKEKRRIKKAKKAEKRDRRQGPADEQPVLRKRCTRRNIQKNMGKRGLGK